MADTSNLNNGFEWQRVESISMNDKITFEYVGTTFLIVFAICFQIHLKSKQSTQSSHRYGMQTANGFASAFDCIG